MRVLVCAMTARYAHVLVRAVVVHRAAVAVLVDAGADRTIKDKLFGGTADDWAAYLKRPEHRA